VRIAEATSACSLAGATRRHKGRSVGQGSATKVLFPTNAAFDFGQQQDGVEYVGYDPFVPVPEEHFDAEVLVAWLNPPNELRHAAQELKRLKLVQGLMAGPNTLIAAGFAGGVPISNGRGLQDGPMAEYTVAFGAVFSPWFRSYSLIECSSSRLAGSTLWSSAWRRRSCLNSPSARA